MAGVLSFALGFGLLWIALPKDFYKNRFIEDIKNSVNNRLGEIMTKKRKIYKLM